MTKFILVIIYVTHGVTHTEFDSPWACARAAKQLEESTYYIRTFCFAKDGPKPLPDIKKEKM